MLSQLEMKNILKSMDPPEYITHHMNRIITCIHDLQENLPLRGLKTLDLGHDGYVGLLLSKCGAKLTGNIPPSELVGVIAPPAQKNTFTLPSGESINWELSAFDFESVFPFDDGCFDLITGFEVIEHITDNPRSVLKEINRVLKKSGYLYIGTPNICSLTKILKCLQHANPYDSKPYSQNFGPRHFMCHIYEYSTWELKELIKSEGFEIISVNTWNPYNSDPSSIRANILQFLFAISLMMCGYIKAGLLIYKQRGHQIGLLARKI